MLDTAHVYTVNIIPWMDTNIAMDIVGYLWQLLYSMHLECWFIIEYLNDQVSLNLTEMITEYFMPIVSSVYLK